MRLVSGDRFAGGPFQWPAAPRWRGIYVGAFGASTPFCNFMSRKLNPPRKPAENCGFCRFHRSSDMTVPWPQLRREPRIRSPTRSRIASAVPKSGVRPARFSASSTPGWRLSSWFGSHVRAITADWPW